MKIKKLYIKNMVCNRCIKILVKELAEIHVEVKNVKLGQVLIAYDSEKIDMKQIKVVLKRNDFELITDKEKQIVEKVKAVILEMIDESIEQELSKKNSEYIGEKVGFNYSYLSRLFTKHEKISIEKYAILLKIEKVKELLEYGEYTINDIVTKVNYSSVQYLSKQFKNTTGLSLSEYKKFAQNSRKPLDTLSLR